MPVDLVLHNAKVYTKAGLVEGGIAVDDGRIVKIAKKTNLPEAASRIGLNGNLALPGVIDSHVHLRDERLVYREDFASGTSAAAAGGITTVIDMPNNKPTTMSTKTLRKRMRLAESRILMNVAFNSAFPTDASEVQKIVDVGAVGFKLYLAQQIDGVNIDDDEALLDAFKAVKKASKAVCVHAEDKSTIEKTERKLKTENRCDTAAFLKAHSVIAEKKAVGRITSIARKARVHVHACHVSSAVGLTEILRAKNNGTFVTCEVTPHHLLLTTRHLKKLGNIALTLPPLRTNGDVSALWRGLQADAIDTIASDHAPHSWEEKTPESIWDVKPGIVGLETMLPLMLTQVNRLRLTLRQLVRLICINPSRIFGLKNRGTLDTGCFADITVVDMKEKWKIDASKFHSKAKFSPFDGWRVKGRPIKTFVNGQLVMDEGDIVAKPGTGRLLR